jgi:hypothetical protein
MDFLTAERALIFRITHIENLRWMLEHGVRCRNSQKVDPNFIPIGNTELIAKRAHKNVPIAPGGAFADYVPFYFTPASPMLLNIHTGYNGVRQVSNERIAVIVSSLRDLEERGRPFVFTDRHAYMVPAKFTSDLDDLNDLPWELWRARDFKYDSERPDKMDRYQAEAMVHRRLRISDISAIAAFSDAAVQRIREFADIVEADIKVIRRPSWYFR